MNILAISQARVGSSRLPGKVLKMINDTSILEIHVNRVLQAKLVSGFILASTINPLDDQIESWAIKHKINLFRGSERDVLDRFYFAAKPTLPEWVVRITSDCPLVDPILIDQVIEFAIESDADYVSNTLEPTYPDGQDIEVFKFSALKKAWELAVSASDREHVTPFIWRNSSFFQHQTFSSLNYRSEIDYSRVRLTIDEQNDFDDIKFIIEQKGVHATWYEYAKFYLDNLNIVKNKYAIRNSGYTKLINMNFNNSIEYRKKIHQLIPGGSHTYSKGDDQFPELSPAAIDHGKGAWVWDIDDNKFLDCSMGLTSVSLGHAFEPVLLKVREELEKGVNFQRPSVIEKKMAETFLALVPQHDMIKFAKNGSTVTTAAVKLARAFTNRNLIAIPENHPFYSYDDWFIGKTLCSKGVPEEFSNLTVTFKPYDINSLKDLFERYPTEIACVITEPEKNFDNDTADFLRQSIKMTHNYGALYVVDEMVTGFKTGLPGTMTKYKIDPDLATWGKGIANGFSFCALTGKKAIMELGGINTPGNEKVFLISTTHGGETHSIAACMATIAFFRENAVVEKIHQTGKMIIEQARLIIANLDLTDYISVSDSYWMPAFIFKNKKREVCSESRTFFMQEMIRSSVLFQGIFAPCYTHNKLEIDFFLNAFASTSKKFKDFIFNSQDSDVLIGEPVKPVFRKYI